MSRRTHLLSAALLAALVLGGCNDSSDNGTPDAAASEEPILDGTSVPQTAGPLTGRQMPDAEVIGDGWTERADPGAGHEDETDPNAPSTQARDVDELMDALVPIGCPEDAVLIDLPRPRYALERTYAGPSGQPGVAVILQFDDETSPNAFLEAFERQMRACPARRVNPDGPVSVQYSSIERTSEQAYGIRQERGTDADPNRYLVIAVRADNRVGLVYLSGVPVSKAVTLGANLIRSIRQD